MSNTVNTTGMPILDSRSMQDFYNQLVALQPAFVPELQAMPQGTVAAMMQIVARFCSVVTQRMNQAPNLDELAFLDMLGINLIPAQPAMAPLVFKQLMSTANSHIAAGTRAGAQAPGAAAPTVFETKNDIAITAAQLTQVVSLWPDRDGYIDHSADLAGGRPFTLFESPDPVTHVLYLAHRTLLAFQGKTTVEVRFTLTAPGSNAVGFRWEFWSGQTWQAFRDFDPTDSTASHDGTVGLTQSGTITLQVACGDSARKSVSNINNYWIRGTLITPLPPDPARTFATVSQVHLRTTIDRSLTHGVNTCHGVAQIDAAYAGNNTLDLTKIFFPLGKSPGIDAAFYLTSQEVFSKPGANVTLCFDTTSTPEQQGDAAGAQYAVDVAKAAGDLVNAATQAAHSAISSADAIGNFFAGQDSSFASFLQSAVSEVKTALTGVNTPGDIAKLQNPLNDLLNALSSTALNNAAGSINKTNWSNAMIPGFESAYFTDTFLDAQRAVQQAQATVGILQGMSEIAAAAAGGATPPVLLSPTLEWEYYNGTSWQALGAGASSVDANNFLASGQISFVVPQDISPAALNGSSALAIRARLISGSYNLLTVVTWTDPTTGQVNYIPVIQPRPPAFADIAIGYTYRSAWAAPQQSLGWNDFAVESHTPGSNYMPYHPVADTLPALYLGFNSPLPNDYISIFFDIAESDTDGPPLVWEAWSAGVWQPLVASDDTGALARAGMVAFLDPGVPARPSVNVASASGWIVTASSALAAAVFSAGDTIMIQPAQAAEVVTIASITGASLNLVTPLAGSYTNTTAVLAALPRFGSSLDWVRARLKTDGQPEFSRVNCIYPNAVWAKQLQTVNNETLGSGTGQPNQSMFFQQIPVIPGQTVQVRELYGAQAQVEFLVLQDQLSARGFTADDIRTISDPRTGQLTEVWVTWIEQPNFYFSGPEDRHYVVDHASGRIQFGNGTTGMLPTPGNSSIVAWIYQAGGGLAGNVAANTITQLLSGTTAQSVTNPVAAEGGADTEAASDLTWRGPQVLRHRGSALSAADYEALALEASPGVAITRCLPATSANLLPAPGWVTLILVPHSVDPRPSPSYELKHEVAAYLAARAPDAIEAGRVNVIPPKYLPVGVSALVTARQIDASGLVKTAVADALNQFFHPLLGGPEGRGWPFGRSVYLSDVAKVIEGVSGVDHVEQLELLLDLIPAGYTVTVPPKRLVAAGPMLITMKGAPNV